MNDGHIEQTRPSGTTLPAHANKLLLRSLCLSTDTSSEKDALNMSCMILGTVSHTEHTVSPQWLHAIGWL